MLKYAIQHIMGRRDVIHKTVSTQHIAMPPQQDRATAMGNMHRKFAEDRSRVSEDIHWDGKVDSQTYKQTILHSPTKAK